MSIATTLLSRAANLDSFGLNLLRCALVLVLLWIGGLKFANYEADSIVPLVANSPLMKFVYRDPASYHSHMNKEGERNPANRRWHEENGTYTFSHLLGAIIVGIGLLIACAPFAPRVSAVGSALLFCMSLTTLSFLITTPEAWVAPLGDTAHGFPYLSGVGRLVIKDAIMLAASLVTLSDSARRALSK